MGDYEVHLHELSLSEGDCELGRLDLQHQGLDLTNVEEVCGYEGEDRVDQGKEVHGSHDGRARGCGSNGVNGDCLVEH